MSIQFQGHDRQCNVAFLPFTQEMKLDTGVF